MKSILFVSSFFVASFAFAQERPCATSKNVTALFSAHFDPVQQNQLETQMDNASDRSPASSPSISLLAQQILKSHKDILAAKKKELTRILELARSGKIRWMGVELPDADVQSLQGLEKDQKDLFVSKLIHRAVDKSSAEDLALLTYDSVHYAVAVAPELFTNIRRIGLEDATIHAASLRQAEELESLNKELKMKNPKRAPALARLDKEVGYILGEKNLKLTTSQEKSIRAFPDTGSQILARRRLNAAKKLVELSSDREKKTASRLAELSKEPGLFTMGAAHEKNLRELLTQICP